MCERYRMLIPSVCVVVHPVDREKHPTYPEGYRWAVMVGGCQPHELNYCANAGHETTQDMAMLMGESHGAAACKALRILGVRTTYSVLRMDCDPIPAEADHRPLVNWG